MVLKEGSKKLKPGNRTSDIEEGRIKEIMAWKQGK
jgi:hypothetical protein